jgi:dUTP pyrophosphatase
MELKVKLLRESAQMPTRATDGSAGLDLYSPEDVWVEDGETRVLPLGIAIEIPAGYEGQIRPRSSTSKASLLCQLGTIDADFRGEIGAIVHALNGPYHVTRGQRIAQLVIGPVVLATPVTADELSSTVRGEQGFGSTGR